MAALNESTLAGLPAGVGRFAYDRSRVSAGIAHLSVGNFHRAHQASYLDRCLALPGGTAWGICGVGVVDSPGERAKAEAMVRQDKLYTLTLFPPHGQPESRVIGSIVDYLFAPADTRRVVARLGEPGIRIVSMTITEGGYNLDDATGRFRLDAPEIAHDLAQPDAPRTVFGLIVAALAGRRPGSALAHQHVEAARAGSLGSVHRGVQALPGDDRGTWGARCAERPRGAVLTTGMTEVTPHPPCVRRLAAR